MIDRREEFKKIAHTNYPKEIEKFILNLVNQNVNEILHFFLSYER
jgi:hypothetical protein